jgi:endonuclease/exonuclease/phosphatase family metal-dependent hydrolase
VFIPLAGGIAVLQGRLSGRRGLLAGGLAGLLALGPLMGLCWGRGGVASGERLRVVTANVQSYTANLDEVGTNLAALDPDVVFLEEVWTLRHLAVLERHLPEFRFFQAGGMINADSPEIGVFVGTRLPCRAESARTLDRAMVLQVEAPFGAVTVGALHGRKRFSFGSGDVLATVDMQLAQASVMASALRGGGYAVLGGDFNGPPETPAGKLLRRQMMDSFSEAGQGYGLTFPSWCPVLRLDQILHGGGLRTLRCWTVWTGSDHLAVAADLAPETLKAQP